MDFDYIVIPAIILAVGTLVIWFSIRRMLALSRKNCRMWRKVAQRIVLAVAVTVRSTRWLFTISGRFIRLPERLLL